MQQTIRIKKNPSPNERWIGAIEKRKRQKHDIFRFLFDLIANRFHAIWFSVLLHTLIIIARLHVCLRASGIFRVLAAFYFFFVIVFSFACLTVAELRLLYSLMLLLILLLLDNMKKQRMHVHMIVCHSLLCSDFDSAFFFGWNRVYQTFASIFAFQFTNKYRCWSESTLLNVHKKKESRTQL